MSNGGRAVRRSAAKGGGIRAQVSAFLREALDFEAALERHGMRVREQSKLAYGAVRLDSRLTFMAIGNRLLSLRNGVPGTTSDIIEERLALIMALYQGLAVIEKLVSEGQYIKAAAAIKQDVEAIARLEELSTSPEQRRVGGVPQMRFIPKPLAKMYGDLNDVAHITKHQILRELLHSHLDGDAHGLSSSPFFRADVAVQLYDLHLWLLSALLKHHVILLVAMYGDEVLEELRPEMTAWISTRERLRDEAGWIDAKSVAG